jgi:hypothetical protein
MLRRNRNALKILRAEALGRRSLGTNRQGFMSGSGHGEKNSRRTYLVRIASKSGIPKCSLIERVRVAKERRSHGVTDVAKRSKVDHFGARNNSLAHPFAATRSRATWNEGGIGSWAQPHRRRRSPHKLPLMPFGVPPSPARLGTAQAEHGSS